MLVVDSVSIRLGKRQILKDVSLTLHRGEVIGLCGSNGSGKSTLVKTIAGLIRPSSGDIRFATRSLVGLVPHIVRQHGLAYLPQNAPVFPGLSVQQNLAVARNPDHSRKRDNWRVLRESGLETLLADMMRKRAGLLSSGQKQLVSLAMVLGGPADAFMLDEPFAPLAGEARAIVARAIQYIVKEKMGSVLIVEHDTRIVNFIANRIYELEICTQGSRIKERDNALKSTGQEVDDEISKIGN